LLAKADRRIGRVNNFRGSPQCACFSFAFGCLREKVTSRNSSKCFCASRLKCHCGNLTPAFSHIGYSDLRANPAGREVATVVAIARGRGDVMRMPLAGTVIDLRRIERLCPEQAQLALSAGSPAIGRSQYQDGWRKP
jgi:hypothetical protein